MEEANSIFEPEMISVTYLPYRFHRYASTLLTANFPRCHEPASKLRSPSYAFQRVLRRSLLQLRTWMSASPAHLARPEMRIVRFSNRPSSPPIDPQGPRYRLLYLSSASLWMRCH